MGGDTEHCLFAGAANVVVRKCKIHNDASVDISVDGTMLAALVPESQAMTMVGRYLGVLFNTSKAGSLSIDK